VNIETLTAKHANHPRPIRHFRGLFSKTSSLNSRLDLPPRSSRRLMMIVAKWDEGCPCGPVCRSVYLAGMSGMKAGIELNKDVDILLLLRAVTSPLRDRLGVQQLPKTLGCFDDLLACNKKSSEARRFNNPQPNSFDVNMRWDFPGWVSSMLTLLFTHY
jgi:hypothetical protein